MPRICRMGSKLRLCMIARKSRKLRMGRMGNKRRIVRMSRKLKMCRIARKFRKREDAEDGQDGQEFEDLQDHPMIARKRRTGRKLRHPLANLLMLGVRGFASVVGSRSRWAQMRCWSKRQHLMSVAVAKGADAH